jgi:hypothetical protein
MLFKMRKNRFLRVIIVLISIFLISLVVTIGIFLINLFRTNNSRVLIVDNDEYISGNYLKRECGNVVQNFFPSYESVIIIPKAPLSLV